MILRPFTFFLLLFYVNTLHGIEFARTVVVESEYENRQRVVGTGALIEVPTPTENRYFILTAAHVSQGENLKVFANDNELQLKDRSSRISDSRLDIELIEIERPRDLLPLAKLEKSMSGDAFFHVALRSSPGSLRLVHPLTGEQLKPFYVGLSYDAKTKGPFATRSFVLVPPGSYSERAENLGHWIDSQNDPLDYLQESLYGDTLFTPATGLIAEGMSGAPLVQSRRIDGKIYQIIDGVAIQYHRFGSKSYFAKSQSVLGLLNSYLAGNRGAMNQYRWKHSNGSLYRVFCVRLNGRCRSASEEMTSPRGPVGGVRGDGGFSVGGDKVSVSLSALGAPIQIEGQAVFGFRAQRKSAGSKPFYIEANLGGVDFVERNQDLYDFEVIGANFLARDLLLQRYQNKSQEAFSLPFELSYKEYPLIKAKIDTFRMDFVLPLGRAQTKSAEMRPRDVVSFSLDERGRLMSGQKTLDQYRPIIRVRGSLTGVDYFVDIRQLFFLDLSELPVDQNLYSSVMHIERKNQDVSGFIEEVFARGGLINLRLASNPRKQAIVQFYSSPSNLLGGFLNPLWELLDPRN